VSIDRFRAFLAILEEGSLNAASARLRISQPALSRQMQGLEHELGGPLLERSATGVRPTAAGNALAKRMRGVIADYDAAVAEAQQIALGQSEQLRVGYLASSAQCYLHPALGSLRRAHPAVKVKLLDLSPGEQITALRRGEIDLAVIGQEGCVLAREFYTKNIATLRLLAVLPADHPLAARSTLKLADLRDMQFISTPEAEVPGRNRWVVQLCRKAGFRPKFGQEGESISHALAQIVSDGSVLLAPEYLRDFPAPAVAMIPVSDRHATWEFLIVWQRGRTGAALRVLIDALTEIGKEQQALHEPGKDKRKK
jgi:DNA-binding transcriptional LysR family regulator